MCKKSNEKKSTKERIYSLINNFFFTLCMILFVYCQIVNQPNEAIFFGILAILFRIEIKDSN